MNQESTAVLADVGEPISSEQKPDLRAWEIEPQRREVRATGATPIDGKGITAVGAVPAIAAEEQATPLFSPDEKKDLRARWDTIQNGFVDEPRRVMEEAASLVLAAMKRLTELFADERANLEAQWDQGDSASTEDLRLALRRYRSFFGRLLSV